MKVVNSFLEPAVDAEVKKAYGEDFSVKKDRIIQSFKTYPYPKDVGYWFVRDNSLYLVVNERT